MDISTEDSANEVEITEAKMTETCEVQVEDEDPQHNIDNESFLQNIEVGLKEDTSEADAMAEKVGDEDKIEKKDVPNGETEVVDNGLDAKDEGADKYSKEDAPRRVLMKNINRKKTADELEDYVFDNYSECGVEDVFSIMVKNNWFSGNAIITFETAEKAKAFLAMEFRNEAEITYKRKLVKISLEENLKKREERLKETKETQSATATSGGGDTGKSKTVICAGFEAVSMNQAEIHNYMVMNHESVADVKMDQGKTYITFEDQRSADRFLSLAYVKFKGKYVHRKYFSFPQQQKTPNPQRRAEKRKHEDVPKLQNLGIQFKLSGFTNPETDYRDIRTVLETNYGLMVKFVSYVSGEAMVQLSGMGVSAREAVDKLGRNQMTVKGERIMATLLTRGEEEAVQRREWPGSKRGGGVGGARGGQGGANKVTRRGGRGGRKQNEWIDY